MPISAVQRKRLIIDHPFEQKKKKKEVKCAVDKIKTTVNWKTYEPNV